MERFEAEVDASDMPPAKKAAAKALVRRISNGERIGVVLADLRDDLGLTDAMILRSLRPAGGAGGTVH
jgi:hypothetical protein